MLFSQHVNARKLWRFPETVFVAAITVEIEEINSFSQMLSEDSLFGGRSGCVVPEGTHCRRLNGIAAANRRIWYIVHHGRRTWFGDWLDVDGANGWRHFASFWLTRTSIHQGAWLALWAFGRCTGAINEW